MLREFHITVNDQKTARKLARSLRKQGFDARCEWANLGAVVVRMNDGFSPYAFWPGQEADRAEAEAEALKNARKRIHDAVKTYMLRAGRTIDYAVYHIS